MALIDTIYKFLTRIRIGFSSFLVLLLVINPVFAQDDPAPEQEVTETPAVESFEDPYLVENIEADATADNAVMAREKAFEAAQIRGYEELAKRFLSDEALKEFEAPDIEDVSAFVQDFEVTNEQLSLTRYKGVYNIRFATNTFKTPQAEGASDDDALLPQAKELLVLPFLEINDRYYLWQINPYWDAWKRAQSKKILGKISVPNGNAEDVASIHDGQGLRYDPAAVNAMRIRYQAKDVAILIASPETLSDNTLNIAVSLYNAKPYGPELSRQISVRAYPGEGQEQLYNRVVATTAQTLHQQWERQTSVQRDFPSGIGAAPADPSARPAPILSGAPNRLVAQISFSNARQWVETKKAIEAIGGIDAIQIKSLSAQSATVEMKFLGSIDSLRAALFRQGVRLDNAPSGGIYQLAPTRR